MLKNRIKLLYIIISVEILSILALLPGCFSPEKVICTYYGEDIAESWDLIENGNVVHTEMMELTAGVYRIYVQSEMEPSETLFVEMNYENGYTDSLLGNGVTILGGNDDTDFEVYVTDKIPSAYLAIDFGNTDVSKLRTISVSKTNYGRRIFTFLLALIYLALDTLVYLRDLIVNGKLAVRKQIVIAAISILCILQYIPYLNDTMIFKADLPYHLLRFESIKEAILSGESFPFRIPGYWLAGHGYASSFFYSDFFLFIPAGLRLIGLPFMTSYKLFMFIVIVATTIITYVSFNKCVKNEYAALIGTMVYVLAPYRFNNMYNRGAVGEYLAMTFTPIVLCGIYLLFTEDVNSKEYRRNKWWLIIGMSAILECHLLTAEMVTLCILLFCILFIRKTFRKQTFMQLAEATGIVVALNCCFWLPMLYMMSIDTYRLQDIISKNLISGIEPAVILQVWQNVGGGGRGIYGEEPFTIGTGVILFLVYGIILTFHRKKGERNKACIVSAAFCIITLLMSTCVFPWDIIQKWPLIGQVVQSMQFPFRWLSLAGVFAGAFSSFFTKELIESGKQRVNTLLGGLVTATVVVCVYQISGIMFDLGTGNTKIYTAENMGTISVIQGEYLLTYDSLFDYTYHDPVADEGLEWYDYEKNATDISVTLNNTLDKELFIELPIIGYKGYAVSDGTDAAPGISDEKGAHGDLRIAVPAGYSGRINISYKGFAIFKISELISSISLVCIIVYALRGYLSGRKRGMGE